MGLLRNLKAAISDKLLGSDLDIKLPGIADAPELTLDFTLAKLRLRHATHTAMFPIYDEPRDMDIRDTGNFKQNRDGSFAKRVYVRGWTLKGKADRSLGGVKVSITILNKSNLRDENNEFNVLLQNYFELEILKYCNKIFGLQNDGASLGSLGNAFYTYPISESELNYKTINGTYWCVFSGGQKGHPGEVVFATVLSCQHLLLITFDTEAYNGVDYYSPATNLRQACETIIKEFMDNVHVALSPQSLAEKRQAEHSATEAKPV